MTEKAQDKAAKAAEPATGTAAEFPEGARIEALPPNKYRMRFKHEKQRQYNGDVACGGKVFKRRPDGTYLVDSELAPQLEHHGMEMC